MHTYAHPQRTTIPGHSIEVPGPERNRDQSPSTISVPGPSQSQKQNNLIHSSQDQRSQRTREEPGPEKSQDQRGTGTEVLAPSQSQDHLRPNTISVPGPSQPQKQHNLIHSPDTHTHIHKEQSLVMAEVHPLLMPQTPAYA